MKWPVLLGLAIWIGYWTLVVLGRGGRWAETMAVLIVTACLASIREQ